MRKNKVPVRKAAFIHLAKLDWYTIKPQVPYIGNLSYQATEDDLKTVFADYGTVKRVVLPTDRETGRVRGFAFVEMTEDAEEESAISQLDGAEWMGRQLRVNKARPRENNRGGSRRNTANNAW